MSVYLDPTTGELVRDELARKTHPAADAFPMASADDLNALAVDIVRNGLQHPIVVTKAGEVLDGRNRLAACALVNVEPTFIAYDGDPWSYVISANAMRRNLTTGQRAACVALLLHAQGKRQNGRWARGSVPGDPGDGDNPRSLVTEGWSEAIRRAGVVLDWSTSERDLVGQVAAGTLALDAAYKHALDLKNRAEWEAEQDRKRREAEIAADDAELASLLSIFHNALAVDLAKCERAGDLDNWRGVRSLAPRIRKLLDRMEATADDRLA